VPVHVVGEPAPETLVVTEHPTVTVEAEATHIPEYIEVDVEGAEVGTQIFARDLKLPSGSALHLDDDTLVVNITHAPTAAEVEADLEGAEAEAGSERAEPEAPAETEAGEGEGASEESAGE
jgi:large subunit ribosomal protein L25